MNEPKPEPGGRCLHMQIVSPDGVIWEGGATSAVLPALDGEVGILPGHAPLIALLGSGEARVIEGGHTHSFALSGGFMEVASDQLTVIVEKAETPETADVEAARKTLARLAEPTRRDFSKHEEELASRRLAQARLLVASKRAK